jgi:hypothetical protein
MIKMRYSKDGIAVNDWEIEDVNRRVLAHKDSSTELVFSTENIFWRVYLAVAQGDIHQNQVVFLYEDKVIRLSKDKANREEFPRGFLDLDSNLKKAIYQYLI